MSASIAAVQDVIIKKGGCELQPSFSFTWEKGQQWCVTGPTGSGKTTFLKILTGISFTPGSKISFPFLEEIKKTSGKQLFISDMIAFVPQEIKISAGFYIEDLYYQRRFQAAEQDDIPSTKEVLLRAAHEDEARVAEAAQLMGLAPLLDQPYVQLSNGQTRRLMIAIALVKQPRILVLDNPYTGLDQETRVALNEQIKVLIEHGIHIFIAAHEHELPAIGFVTDILRLKPFMQLQQADAVLPEYYRTVNPPDAETAVRMEHTQIKYGEKIVLNIPHWRVKPSERWIIQGKNGSGKSTLLSVIMADHPQAYANEIYLFGKKRGSGESIWEIKKRIGFFSPELLRYFEPRLTGVEVIASGENDYVGQIAVMTPARRQKVTELAEWLEISSLLNIAMSDLSLGQQKMVLIARAMFRNPELLILDEPLQGMDAQWREHFKQKIDKFSQNRTVLYVTHDDDEIPDGNWKKLSL